MILGLKESQELCDWLIQRGLGLGEAAVVILEMNSGDSLCIAIIKVFQNRQKQMEKVYEKNSHDWAHPLTP